MWVVPLPEIGELYWLSVPSMDLYNATRHSGWEGGKTGNFIREKACKKRCVYVYWKKKTNWLSIPSLDLCKAARHGGWEEEKQGTS